MADMSTAYEILTGMESVKLWAHTAGTAEPEPDDDLGAAGWASLGETDGGITVKAVREITEHFVDQIMGSVKANVTSMELVVSLSLAVSTLENWAYFFDTTVETTAAASGVIGKKRLPLYGGDSPTQRAFYLTGKSAYGDHESGWWMPYAYIGGEAEVEYTKDGKAILPIEVHVTADLNAASADEMFGVLCHKTDDAL
jgi:hypothetical protein